MLLRSATSQLLLLLDYLCQEAPARQRQQGRTDGAGSSYLSSSLLSCMHSCIMMMILLASDIFESIIFLTLAPILSDNCESSRFLPGTFLHVEDLKYKYHHVSTSLLNYYICM